MLCMNSYKLKPFDTPICRIKQNYLQYGTPYNFCFFKFLSKQGDQMKIISVLTCRSVKELCGLTKIYSRIILLQML